VTCIRLRLTSARQLPDETNSLIVLLKCLVLAGRPCSTPTTNWLLIFLMFCWPCILVYQYSETNVMHFLFNLLRVTGLYMFRALLAHPQEALHKRHLVYCVRVMSVGCTRINPGASMPHIHILSVLISTEARPDNWPNRKPRDLSESLLWTNFLAEWWRRRLRCVCRRGGASVATDWLTL
jgi:hypothetical protein